MSVNDGGETGGGASEREGIGQVSSRIRELRDVLDISCEEVAGRVGVSMEEYAAYEKGETYPPISVLYNIAAVFNVDPAELMTGEEPKMDEYALTRREHDIKVRRTDSYSYHALAFAFRNRDMDPMIVDLKHTEKTELTTHPGQEFNYVLDGEVEVTMGERTFVLLPGDSFYLDPAIPHGHRAVTPRARFLTVINERNETRKGWWK